MPRQQPRHGSNAGYRAEKAVGEACDLCKAAHAEFQRQYTKRGRESGLKYRDHDVIINGTLQSKAQDSVPRPSPGRQDASGGNLTDKFVSALSTLTGHSEPGYTDTEQPEDYIREIDPDPEPDHDGKWEDASDTDYVINAAGMKKIEDNLGTYLSVVGMTVEMIDPYCGPILAENFDEIVKRWARVIGHYPKAAEMFMEGKGGVVFAWISALQATWPFLVAIYEHHLSKTVRTDANGKLMRLRRTDGAFVDATMPPMADTFNYTAG